MDDIGRDTPDLADWRPGEIRPSRRFAFAVAAAALLLAGPVTAGPVSSAAPSVAPTASPITTPLPPGDIGWTPVSGPLGGSIPGFHVVTGAPVAWDQGFAVLETEASAGTSTRDDVTWGQPAVWRSSADGPTWVPHHTRHVPGMDRSAGLLTPNRRPRAPRRCRR